MKSILFIIPFCRPSGVGSSLASIYNGLDRAKYNIFVFSIQEGLKGEVESLPYYKNVIQSDSLLSYYFGDYRRAPFFLKLLIIGLKVVSKISYRFKALVENFVENRVVCKIEKQYHFDTVIGFMEGASTKMASFFKVPNRVAWIHCNYNTSVPENISEENIYSSFKTIVCVSKYTAKVFQERYKRLADKVVTIYNPQDTNSIISKSLEVINDNSFNNSVFTIISIGRINHIKRFRLIPQIASQIKQMRRDFNWYIIGAEQEKEEMIAILRGIEENGVENQVHWLPYKSNPYPYLKASDLLVSTSISEACPMIFNEARALDVPIVTSDFPTSYEFVDSEKDGIISSLEAMSDNILRMMNDRALYQSIKKHSKEVVIDSRSIMNKIEKII